MHFTIVLATFLAAVAAQKQGNPTRRFAVLRHKGRGPLTTCRADPIVSPGTPSAHVHTVLGASNFGLNVTGESLRNSKCTTAKPKGDLSSYWFPTLMFKDPETGLLEQVKFFYANAYYFFDATNDVIKSFPVGLQIVSGQASIRSAPAKSGNLQLDPSKGPIQAAQITCPRSNYNAPSYPANSDGSQAGIVDDRNPGAGIGFPIQNCDGYASPMRVDVHFPSCYNPAAGLTNYKNNMAFPTPASNGRLDCPEGWIHVPHMFYETYWDTAALLPRFQSLIGKESPFVFSNGDATGFSAHGDFIAGWDEDELQNIIDNCDAGHAGLHACPGLKLGVNPDNENCEIECPVKEKVDGKLEKLPGNNAIAGWKYGGGNAAPAPAPAPAPNPAPAPAPEPKPSNAPAPVPAPVPAPASSSAPVVKVVSSSAAPPPPPPPSTTLIPVVRPSSSAVEAPVSTPVVESTSKAPVAAPAPTPKTTTVYDTVTVWATKTVYEQPAAPTKSVQQGSKAVEIGGFKYVGCYKDQSDRVISGKILPNIGQVSNTACVDYCSSKGFSVAGSEYGGECYCGNSLNVVEKLDDAKCNMACKGDGSQKCGGDWALSVFSKGGAVPGAEKRHVHNHYLHHARTPSRHHFRR